MNDTTEKALELGFSSVGIVPAEHPFEWSREVQRRIDESLIPEEEWSRRNLKHDPAEVIADAKQVLILVGSHEPFKEPFPPGIAVYSSHYQEYPRYLEKAESFAGWLRSHGINAVVTSKLPLKHLAVKAGLGVYRQNSLVYSNDSGSFIILFGIVTDTEIGEATLSDEPLKVASDCADCNKCVYSCPTGAIMPEGTIDLTKCIRAHMGTGTPVPPEIREAYGVRLIGCEICQRICPHNADVLRDLSLPSGEELELFSLPNLLNLGKSPSRKEALNDIADVIGKNYARRNRILGDAVIAAGNMKDPNLLEYLAETLKYPHVPVRAHSAWAIGRIGTPKAKEILLSALQEEKDPMVISEIEAALGELQ
ncbi:MAG: 4Fe-4S double cluster binding domain-containing protein [Bacillota bacterium]|jgi:epoxyqueuosine reductase QueG